MTKKYTDQHYTTLGGNVLHSRCALLTVKSCPHFKLLSQQGGLDDIFVVSNQPAFDFETASNSSRLDDERVYSVEEIKSFDIDRIVKQGCKNPHEEEQINAISNQIDEALTSSKIKANLVKPITFSQLKGLVKTLLNVL